MLSIAICCYQRADDLSILLDSLSGLSLNGLGVDEILLVNNGSCKRVSEVVTKFSSKLPLRELFEDKLGLANARNKALAEFSTEYIWFLDDDILVFESTLEGYAKALDAIPECDYFGGPISVEWQGNQPAWLKGDDLVLLNGLFGIYQLGSKDLIYGSHDLGPFGANFILHRRLVEAVGLFNPDLGVRGKSIARGEEREYFDRARDQGFSGCYVAMARVGHRFQVDRLNLAYLWRYGFEKGREQVILHERRSAIWVSQAADQFARGVWQILRGRRDRFYQCWINMGMARGRYVASKGPARGEA